MNAGKPSSEETVVSVLGSKRDAIVSEIAAATGLGRSTVGKVLVRLETAGHVSRSPGGREGGRRLPDRWALVAPRKPARRRTSGKRLRPGELDGLVLDCLARLAAAGRVRQVSKRPRRYGPA